MIKKDLKIQIIAILFFIVLYICRINVIPDTLLRQEPVNLWIDDMKNHASSTTSQFGEDGLLKFLFSNIESSNTFLEFGAHLTESNTLELRKEGWKGWSIDATSESNELNFAAFYVRTDTVNDMMDHLNVPNHLGLLSIDIDSFDFFLLKEILLSRSVDVLLLEFNPAWAQDYCSPPNFYLRYHCDLCYGNSLSSFYKMLQKKDYHLIHVSGLPHNAFFLNGKYLNSHFKMNNAMENYVKLPLKTFSVFEDNKNAYFKYKDKIAEVFNCENPIKLITCKEIYLFNDICNASPRGGRYCKQMPSYMDDCNKIPFKIWDGSMFSGSCGSGNPNAPKRD